MSQSFELMDCRVDSSEVFMSGCDEQLRWQGAILARMVWLVEGHFLCPSFSFLTSLNLLPTCSYWNGGKILLHGPSPGEFL